MSGTTKLIPGQITHCTELRDADIFMTPKGLLALIIPGEATMHQFYINDRTKATLAVDLIQSATDSMLRRIDHLEDVNVSLNNNVVEMERKYEGRGEDE